MKKMLEDVVKDIKQACGAEAAAIIGRDGLTVSADMPPGVLVETFSIMCATILGAAVTANSELRHPIPTRVTVDSDDGRIIIMGAGKRAILVVAVKNTVKPEFVYREMQRGVERIKDLM